MSTPETGPTELREYLTVLWRWRVRLHLDELRRRRRRRPDGTPVGSDLPSS